MAAASTGKPKRGGTKPGTPRPRLPVVAYVELGQQIILMRHAPKTKSWREIVKATGVPLATAKRMYDTAYAINAMHGDPENQAVIDRCLAILVEAAVRVSELAEDTEQEAVALGAYRTMVEFTIKHLELMAATGRLVFDDPTAERMAHLRRMAARFSEILQDKDMPVELTERIEEIYRETLPGTQRELAAGANA